MWAKEPLETLYDYEFMIDEDGKAVDWDGWTYPYYTYTMPNVKGLPFVSGEPIARELIAGILDGSDDSDIDVYYLTTDAEEFHEELPWEDIADGGSAYYYECGIDSIGGITIVSIEWSFASRFGEEGREAQAIIGSGYSVDLEGFLAAHPECNRNSPEYDG